MEFVVLLAVIAMLYVGFCIIGRAASILVGGGTVFLLNGLFKDSTEKTRGRVLAAGTVLLSILVCLLIGGLCLLVMFLIDKLF